MFAAAAVAVSLGLAVVAAPTASNAVDDKTVLNFALTLEHLENTFYSEGLQKYGQSGFNNAVLPNGTYGWFQQISKHEAAHVAFLSNALGNDATKACNYSFPHDSPESFAALAMVLEGVGVSAYTGAAQLISDKTYLTAAASVLSTEARHAAFVSGFALGGEPWSGPEDTPLGVSSVYHLAAPFITSCPSSNPTLPVVPFPALNITASSGNTPSNVTVGSKANVAFNTTAVSAAANGTNDRYVVFYYGLSATAVKLGSDNTVQVPTNISGTVYAVLTSTANMASDSNTLAGPAVLSLYNSSNAANPAFAGQAGTNGVSGNGTKPSSNGNGPSANGDGSSSGSGSGGNSGAVSIKTSGAAVALAGVLAFASLAL